MRYMCTRKLPGSQLAITLARGWWIFNWIETWEGSLNVGWKKNGKTASARVDTYLSELAWKYWKEWSD